LQRRIICNVIDAGRVIRSGMRLWLHYVPLPLASKNVGFNECSGVSRHCRANMIESSRFEKYYECAKAKSPESKNDLLSLLGNV